MDTDTLVVQLLNYIMVCSYGVSNNNNHDTKSIEKHSYDMTQVQFSLN